MLIFDKDRITSIELLNLPMTYCSLFIQEKGKHFKHVPLQKDNDAYFCRNVVRAIYVFIDFLNEKEDSLLISMTINGHHLVHMNEISEMVLNNEPVLNEKDIKTVNDVRTVFVDDGDMGNTTPIPKSPIPSKSSQIYHSERIVFYKDKKTDEQLFRKLKDEIVKISREGTVASLRLDMSNFDIDWSSVENVLNNVKITEDTIDFQIVAPGLLLDEMMGIPIMRLCRDYGCSGIVFYCPDNEHSPNFIFVYTLLDESVPPITEGTDRMMSVIVPIRTVEDEELSKISWNRYTKKVNHRRIPYCSPKYRIYDYVMMNDPIQWYEEQDILNKDLFYVVENIGNTTPENPFEQT